MKKLKGLILILIISTTNLIAQNKDIRINFGFQGNLPERLFNSNITGYNNKNGGFGTHLYPKWNYSDNISLGLNMDYALVIEDYQTDDIGTFDIFSFSPTINYYLTNFKIRPFIGFGLGIYHVLYHTPKLNVGIKPLVGFSVYNFFDLPLEYNKILADINVDPDVLGDFDNYYIAIKGSFSIGVIKTTKK